MPRRPHDFDAWAADTIISRPVPSEEPVLVDFQGFGFTMNGLVHNLTEGEVEEMITPTFSPEDYQGNEPPIDFEEQARGSD